jgi:prepilin-type N-terminal cleavage/methylation domain-containing protein
MNKKGFTLIELLAVIIILGVLMIIAIPSVTTYIQNSRKSAWVDTGVAYIKSTVNKVNEGAKLQFFATETLYLVPAGHKAEYSCVPVESGGQSPFNENWNYAYVGVIYNGQGYDYYYIAEDGAGQGVPFMTQKDLADKGTDNMYAGTKAKDNSVEDKLKALYAGTYEAETNFSTIESDVVTFTIGTNPTSGSAAAKMLDALNYKSGSNNALSYTKVVVVKAPGCASTGH